MLLAFRESLFQNRVSSANIMLFRVCNLFPFNSFLTLGNSQKSPSEPQEYEFCQKMFELSVKNVLEGYQDEGTTHFTDKSSVLIKCIKKLILLHYLAINSHLCMLMANQSVANCPLLYQLYHSIICMMSPKAV